MAWRGADAARLHRLRRLRALCICGAIAMAMHGAAAWMLSQPLGGLPAARTATVSLRLIDAPRAPAATGEATVIAPARAARASSAGRAVVGPAATPAAEAAAAPDAQPAIEPLAVAEPTSGVAEGGGVDRYVPRPELTVAPVVGEAVAMMYPEGAPETGAFIARLALYIDEAGQVRRVEPEGQRLPPPLEDAARQAFLAARFTPGEIEGVAVKSLIRVEVSFESRLREP